MKICVIRRKNFVAKKDTARSYNPDSEDALELATYAFTLIHKFNQIPETSYSRRDDIIVMVDEAHKLLEKQDSRPISLFLIVLLSGPNR